MPPINCEFRQPNNVEGPANCDLVKRFFNDAEGLPSDVDRFSRVSPQQCEKCNSCKKHFQDSGLRQYDSTESPPTENERMPYVVGLLHKRAMKYPVISVGEALSRCARKKRRMHVIRFWAKGEKLTGVVKQVATVDRSYPLFEPYDLRTNYPRPLKENVPRDKCKHRHGSPVTRRMSTGREDEDVRAFECDIFEWTTNEKCHRCTKYDDAGQ